MVGAELEEDVGAGGVLEEVVETHDVPVPQRAVDPHLRLQLLCVGRRSVVCVCVCCESVRWTQTYFSVTHILFHR